MLAGGVTVFSLGDMILYNRRKRTSFYAEQRMLLEQRLGEAREAAAKGIADEDQMLLINRERAADEAEAARKGRKGIFKEIKAIFSTEGLKKEEVEGGLEVLGGEGLRRVGVEAEGTTAVEAEQHPRLQGLEMSQGTIPTAVEEKRREGERALEQRGIQGGPLDQMAEQVTVAVQAKGGWTSWMRSK